MADKNIQMKQKNASGTWDNLNPKTTSDNVSDIKSRRFTSNEELNLKANVQSPNFTGSPTAPTQTTGDNSTKIATTAFVMNNAPVRIKSSKSISTPGWYRVAIRSVGRIGNLTFKISNSFANTSPSTIQLSIAETYQWKPSIVQSNGSNKNGAAAEKITKIRYIYSTSQNTAYIDVFTDKSVADIVYFELEGNESWSFMPSIDLVTTIPDGFVAQEFEFSLNGFKAENAEFTNLTTTTQTIGDNSTKVATTEFVNNAVINSANKTTLTGLSTATNSSVLSTDNVLTALGKLQAQSDLKIGAIKNQVAGTSGTVVKGVLAVGIDRPETEILIKTGIPFRGSIMPNVYLRGYFYGPKQPINMQILWYVYNDNIIHSHVLNNGDFRPTVKLFRYYRNDTAYIGIALIHDSSPAAQMRFIVDYDFVYASIDAYDTGWSFEHNGSDMSISIVPTDKLVTATYRGFLEQSRINVPNVYTESITDRTTGNSVSTKDIINATWSTLRQSTSTPYSTGRVWFDGSPIYRVDLKLLVKDTSPFCTSKRIPLYYVNPTHFDTGGNSYTIINSYVRSTAYYIDENDTVSWSDIDSEDLKLMGNDIMLSFYGDVLVHGFIEYALTTENTASVASFKVFS